MSTTAITVEWLTVKAAAERISASPSLVRKLIATGQIRAANIGCGQARREWRIRTTDIDEFMKARMYQA